MKTARHREGTYPLSDLKRKVADFAREFGDLLLGFNVDLGSSCKLLGTRDPRSDECD